MTISVIGLGKLGLCTAAIFAAKGKKIIGCDIDSGRVDLLKTGHCYIDEAGLSEKLKEAEGNISFTDNIKEAVKNSERSFIIVPTPSDDNGWFSNDAIMNVLMEASKVLKNKNRFHIINIVSTVMPGSCNKFINYLESTGLVLGRDFGLTYNPEFIAIGTVIDNFMNPDMVLIGANDPISEEIISSDYECMSSNICAMSLINAEITKLSINCFLTAKISFVNELASVCELIPGADIDKITEAMSEDSRIGKKLMKAGLGFGGPCLPRDNIAFRSFAAQRGIKTRIADAVSSVNDNIIGRIINKILQTIPYNGVVDIYGMSYKSGTLLTEGSQSIILRDKLKDAGYQVREFNNEKFIDDISKPDAMIMMSDEIMPPYILSKDIVFIDPWRRFPMAKSTCKDYYALGVGNV